MAGKFSELTKDFSPERRARIETKKAALREEMNLDEIRQALSFTQNTLAEALGVGQAEISKIENRTDVFISTLRRFVNAMGGELEIKAVFPDREIKIRNFSSLVQHDDCAENRTSSGEKQMPRQDDCIKCQDD